jgi:hypothetical protein
MRYGSVPVVLAAAVAISVSTTWADCGVFPTRAAAP